MPAQPRPLANGKQQQSRDAEWWDWDWSTLASAVAAAVASCCAQLLELHPQHCRLQQVIAMHP
jgi:hypothetical protein